MNEQKVNPQAVALRQAFEDWYTLNAFDLSANPSRECHLQWQAWQAASRNNNSAKECEGPYEGSPLQQIRNLQNEVRRLESLLAAK